MTMISTPLFNGALRAAVRQMPSFRFNPFDEDDIVSKASQMLWEAFHLSVPKDDPATAAISQSTLSKDLVERHSETILFMRRRPGPVASSYKGNAALATEARESAGIPIFAPKPIKHWATSSLPLSATFLNQNVPPTVASQNDSDAKENAENAEEGPVISSPHERGNGQPLRMSDYHEESTPPSNRIAPFVQAFSPAIPESRLKVCRMEHRSEELSTGRGILKSAAVASMLSAPMGSALLPLVSIPVEVTSGN
ncbi:hypothetical protein C0995_006850 [Termitomyces sp. Mi166|nr:hypothetical protein C0995_006850 [Termitomyces sp. Mi166\